VAIAYIECNWTATSLGGSFECYELQRSESLAPWKTVACITTESITRFRDYEFVRPSAIVAYRVRVIRADGAASAWSSTDFEAPTAALSWLLVSNEAPALNLEVDAERDTDERHTWEFPTNVAEYEVAGRDGAIQLHGLEDPLDRFTINLVEVDSTHPERAAYAGLLAISRAALSYVAVISPGGGRWLAGVTLEEGGQTDIRQTYRSPLRVRELTRTPSQPDVVAV